MEKESETSWGSGSGRPVTDMRRGNAWQEEGRLMWSFLCTRISYQFSKEKKKRPTSFQIFKRTKKYGIKRSSNSLGYHQVQLCDEFYKLGKRSRLSKESVQKTENKIMWCSNWMPYTRWPPCHVVLESNMWEFADFLIIPRTVQIVSDPLIQTQEGGLNCREWG